MAYGDYNPGTGGLADLVSGALSQQPQFGGLPYQSIPGLFPVQQGVAPDWFQLWMQQRQLAGVPSPSPAATQAVQGAAGQTPDPSQGVPPLGPQPATNPSTLPVPGAPQPQPPAPDSVTPPAPGSPVPQIQRAPPALPQTQRPLYFGASGVNPFRGVNGG